MQQRSKVPDDHELRRLHDQDAMEGVFLVVLGVVMAAMIGWSCWASGTDAGGYSGDRYGAAALRRG
jgi:hypothetical protein